MTDIDTTIADYFELKAGQAKPTPDIDSVVNGHRRLTPAIDESNKPRRRGMLAAAAVLLIAGVGGLMWAQGTRDESAVNDQPSQTRDPQPVSTQLPTPADGESTEPVPSLAEPHLLWRFSITTSSVPARSKAIRRCCGCVVSMHICQKLFG